MYVAQGKRVGGGGGGGAAVRKRGGEGEMRGHTKSGDTVGDGVVERVVMVW